MFGLKESSLFCPGAGSGCCADTNPQVKTIDCGRQPRRYSQSHAHLPMALEFIQRIPSLRYAYLVLPNETVCPHSAFVGSSVSKLGGDYCEFIAEQQ